MELEVSAALRPLQNQLPQRRFFPQLGFRRQVHFLGRVVASLSFRFLRFAVQRVAGLHFCQILELQAAGIRLGVVVIMEGVAVEFELCSQPINNLLAKLLPR